MEVSLITPTADRPLAFRLAEFYVTRQTAPWKEWIVADAGHRPVECTMHQVHLHHPEPAGMLSFGRNLRRALDAVTGDVIVVVEDDDWYAPTHLARLLEQLKTNAVIAGDDQQRYYHVGRRAWRTFDNVGASLCQTAFRRELIPLMQDVIANCLRRQTIGIDRALWEATPVHRRSLKRENTVVGMKGLPGRVGLGIGHRPDHLWQPDPNLETLTGWIGDDVHLYAAFGRYVA